MDYYVPYNKKEEHNGETAAKANTDYEVKGLTAGTHEIKVFILLYIMKQNRIFFRVFSWNSVL